MDYQDLTTLAIAFGLGMLIGLQREKTDSKVAGVRTFTLIAILGVLGGFLTRDLDNPFIFPVLGIALAAFMITGNIIKLKKLSEADVGQTTEVAAMLLFAIGGYLVLGNQIIGVIVGGTMAVLLYVKEHLHDFIDELKEKDLAAIMTFAGISLVILPILPDKTFGPLDVLNPRNIWMMVTLIVGISVVGYFIYKYVGKNAGLISNGILGGLISSTATAVSYSRKAANTKSISKMAAFVITTASAIALVRVIIEVGVVIPEKLPQLIVPLAAEFIIMLAICIALFFFIKSDKDNEEMPEPKNPAQFKSALIFGLLYGLILLAVAFTEEQFGNEALYVVAVISGLTDVDAITLSLSQLMKGGGLETNTGWRLILLATLSNLLFKGIMVITMGTKQLTRWISITFGISIITGLLIIWLWPEGWHF